jgi:asparagine synthase (glutamine-hydrolysing)
LPSWKKYIVECSDGFPSAKYMCGIIGQINLDKPVDRNIFIGMCNALAHRGPDGEGQEYFQRDFIALGHRRLSIIDLTNAGTQPMANEDQTVWVIFNGEIYNFQILRKVLEEKGHHFNSHSDTEVILHSYEEWGIECVKRFRGIFAFGLWDDKKRELFLARDHLGVKPLYYFYNNKTLIFASEIKAIILNPSIARCLRYDAVCDYLSYGYVPFDKSILENIWKLPAGHYLLFSKKKIMVEKYWDFKYTGEITDEEEAKEQLLGSLKDAVKCQLVSDVPLGVFLSGGIDSSAITALMASARPEKINTFTIGFDQERLNEIPYAKRVAGLFNTDHNEQIVTYDIALDTLKSFVDIYDEPFYDSSGIPTYIVSAMARKKVKVILAGDGGDEIFAGYKRYNQIVKVSGFGLPQAFQKMLARLLWYPLNWAGQWSSTASETANLLNQETIGLIPNYFQQIGFLDFFTQKSILSHQVGQSLPDDPYWLIRKFWQDSYPTVTKTQYLDIKTYLVDDILTKVDRASMANSLEVRVPLLDYRLVELAFRISSQLQFARNERKHIFKKTLRRLLPEDVLTTRKKGFSVPMREWIGQGLRTQAEQLIKNGSLVSRSIMNPDQILGFISVAPAEQVWLILSLELWSRRWLDGETVVIT